MKTIIHSKRGGMALIIGGLLVWLATMEFVPMDTPLESVIIHGIGALVFLIIAAFIPERLERQFVSRQSVLAGMSFLVWMSSSTIHKLAMFTWAKDSRWQIVLSFAGPLAFAFGSYRLALFTYRYFQRGHGGGQHQAEQVGAPNP